jgi:hypothetical protein
VKSLRHYHNGTILTPHKCGTKYLNEIFKKSKKENVIPFNDIFSMDFKWLIVRDPYEHLLSAITTVYNNRESVRDLNEILNNFINSLDVHWNNTFYKDMLSHSLNHSFTLVELSNLTDFVEHELIINPLPPFLKRYGTNIIYMSKDNLIDKIKLEYPSEWEILMGLVESEKNYYKMLFDRCDVYNSNLR